MSEVDGEQAVLGGFEQPINYIIGLGMVLLFVGFLSANIYILYLSLIPFFLLAVGHVFDTPGDVRVERRISSDSCRVNDVIEVRTKIACRKGVGLIVVRESIPRDFELVDGSNVHVFFKSLKSIEKEYSYAMRCTVKGEYLLPPVEIECIHIFGMKPSEYVRGGNELRLIVLPLLLPIRRLRTALTRSLIMFPSTSVARRGPQSTDFREIRRYVYGGPIKFINWKATARNPHELPLVNEFEREGGKTVFFILDATPRMYVGSSVENAMEYAITAVASMSYYFIRQAYNVGVYVLGHQRLIIPASGTREFYNIVRNLVKIRRPGGAEGFSEAVEKLERYIVEYNPLIINVTNLSIDLEEDIRQYLRKISKIMRRSSSRGFLPIVFLDISLYDILSRGEEYSKLVGSLISFEKDSLRKLIGSFGAATVTWNPLKQSFSSVIVNLVRMVG